jgi:cell division protein FtsB
MIRKAGTKEHRGVSMLAGYAAVVLMLVLLGIAGENGYLERRAQRREIQAVSAEIEKVRQENQQLNQAIRDLRSDPRAIEELARERLRLARPGEVIITLPQNQPSATPPRP